MATVNGPCTEVGGWVAAQRDGVNRGSNDPGDWMDSKEAISMCNRWLQVTWSIDAGLGSNASNGAIYAYVDGAIRYNHGGIATTGADRLVQYLDYRDVQTGQLCPEYEALVVGDQRGEHGERRISDYGRRR